MGEILDRWKLAHGRPLTIRAGESQSDRPPREPRRHPTNCVHGGESIRGCCGRTSVYKCAILGEATAIECRECEEWTQK